MLTILERGPSPNRRGQRRSLVISAIIIHDTGSRSAVAAIDWLCNPASHVSAHYVIDRDGTVYRLVPDAECAWHAGESVLHGVTGVNEFSIGIEVVDAADVDDPYPPEQLESVAQLVADCCRRYEIPLNRIVGHADIAVPHGRKVDPGPDFPWSRFLLHVAELMSMEEVAS